MQGQESVAGGRRRALRALIGIGLALPLALSLTPAAKAANINDTFDATNQGWRVAQNFHPYLGNNGAIGAAAWTNESGDPIGSIEAPDAADDGCADEDPSTPCNIQAFLSPAGSNRWSGNLSANYGGTLSFEIQPRPADPDSTSQPEAGVYITIESATGAILATQTDYTNFPPAPVLVDSHWWNEISVGLSGRSAPWLYCPPAAPTTNDCTNPPPAGTFDAVLSNVAHIAIGADWLLEPEITGLDNVRLSETLSDVDGDGTGDINDNCSVAANADQADLDLDGRGDACDTDDDGDESLDTADNCATLANPDQADNDSDGRGDVCDSDDDNDAMADSADACPTTAGSAPDGCPRPAAAAQQPTGRRAAALKKCKKKAKKSKRARAKCRKKAKKLPL